jgi:hypothetical protein
LFDLGNVKIENNESNIKELSKAVSEQIALALQAELGKEVSHTN